MDIDPTQPVDDQTGKFVIVCAINSADNRPYPLVVDPTTGELKVNAEFTGEVLVKLVGAGVEGDNVRIFRCCEVGTVTFTGTGLDDLEALGRYLGTADNLDIVVEIDGAGTPDTFKWSKDGGSTWIAETVDITGEEQVLEEGHTIRFPVTTGHTLGDKWEFLLKAGYMINPRQEDGHGSQSSKPTYIESTNSPIAYDATNDAWIMRFFKIKVSPTSGTKDVTTAGTAEPLVASETFASRAMIQAKNDNTGLIFAGDSSVDSTNGVELTAGETMALEFDGDEKIDLNEHYIDSEVDGEGVKFLYWS